MSELKNLYSEYKFLWAARLIESLHNNLEFDSPYAREKLEIEYVQWLHETGMKVDIIVNAATKFFRWEYFFSPASYLEYQINEILKRHSKMYDTTLPVQIEKTTTRITEIFRGFSSWQIAWMLIAVFNLIRFCT